MNLKIKNFGMISDADISIDGLTIVTGENDTGKSTIGKVMFALVRAFNKYEEELEQDNEEFLMNQLDNIYFALRNKIDFKKYTDIKELFYPPNSYMEIREIQQYDKRENVEEKFNDFINLRVEALNNSGMNLDSDTVLEKLNEIKKVLLNKTENEVIQRAINKAMFSEFQDDINYKFDKSNSFINWSDGVNDVFNLEVKKNKVSKLRCYDKINFNDVTYIESPIIFYLNNLSNSPLRFKRSELPLHMSDLLTKLQLSDYFKDTVLMDDNITKSDIDGKIQSIIQGKLAYEKDKKDFIYSKVSSKKTINLKTSNIATGIKSFGMVQLLLKSEVLNQRSLLIIDEPEIHLHPKWQLEYAKLIVEMVEKQIPILLTTHSPYMIQALKVYSENKNIASKTKFYLAEYVEGHYSSIFQDVTNDLNRVFKKLSDPLQELVWN